MKRWLQKPKKSYFIGQELYYDEVISSLAIYVCGRH